MRKVKRSDVVDFQTYADRREAFRRVILDEKSLRRIHVGEHLTFLFETTNTILYQVQEMMRLEQMVREADIRHEIDTYNELLGDEGQLSCTLLIEIDDQKERNEKLAAWLGLPAHLYVRTADGGQIRALWDQAQVGDTRLSSVQYLKFPVGAGVPVGLGSDHPALRLEAELSAEQRQTLLNDLRAS
jgi:Protein of unknown function (DUF3501)